MATFIIDGVEVDAGKGLSEAEAKRIYRKGKRKAKKTEKTIEGDEGKKFISTMTRKKHDGSGFVGTK